MTGRPKSDNPHDKGIRIRLTAHEHKIFKELAASYGMNLSSFVRNLMFQEYFKHTYNQNKRICVICGDEVKEGMTDDEGSFYCHEHCFYSYMDQMYGEGNWMQLGIGHEDGCGGFYIHKSDTSESGFEGTGIYYTEWED